MIVPRTAQALARAAQRLFNHSAHVVIVDPHFAPNRPHVSSVLEAYLDSRDHTPGTPFRVTIHAGRQVLDRKNLPPLTNAEFESALRTRIPPMLRSGQIVTIAVWNEFAGGERLHDRHILCAHGGLSIQGGADTGPATESTTLTRVSPATAREIIDRFDRSEPGSAQPVYDRVLYVEIR